MGQESQRRSGVFKLIHCHRDLSKVARQTTHYGGVALRQADHFTDLPSQLIAGKLRHYRELMKQIIDQTERRVLHGETVPANQKVISVFENYTGIIKKGGRKIVFGHKLFLAGGVSGLMLD